MGGQVDRYNPITGGFLIVQPLMEKELVLHVGMEKTGTTTLQRFLHDNSDTLLDRRICYPRTGRQSEINHHALFSHVSDTHTGNHYARSPLDWHSQLSELREEVRHLDVSKVVLSSELLARNVNFELLKALSSLFSKTSVVVYLRPQETYLASLYAQFVKSVGEHRSFDLSHLPEANFLDICTAWAEFVGDGGRLYVRRYGASYEYNGQIISDFAEIALSLAISEDDHIHPENLNPRLSRDCHEFKRILNLCFPKNIQSFFIWPLEKYSILCDAKNASSYSSTSVLTAAGNARVRQIYEESNARTAKIFMGIDAGILFDPDDISENTGETYEGLSRNSAMEIVSWLVDHFGSDRPEAKAVPGHTQRCIFNGLGLIAQQLLNDIESLNGNHPFTGNTPEFTTDFVLKTLQIKAELSAQHAGL